MMDEHLSGTAALVMVAALGATMGIYARELAVNLNVVEQVALRSAIGALMLYGAMYRRIDLGKLTSAPRREIALITCRALSIYGFAICLGTVAFVHGKFTSVAIVLSLPVPAMMGILLFHERIGLRNALLVFLAFSGVVLTIWAGSDTGTRIDWPLLAALASAVFMSFGILAQRLQSGHFNVMETTFLMIAVAAVALTVVVAGSWMWTATVPQLSWALLGLACAAGATSVSFMLLSNYGVPRVTGVVVNNTLALQPVFAAGSGALLYADRIGPFEATGAGLILISILLLKK